MHHDFLAHFLKGGVAHSLVEYAGKARYPVDLQMRHNPKTGADHASLYVGLTSVLNVVWKPNLKPAPGLALAAHKNWSEAGYGFNPDWGNAAPGETWVGLWQQVEDYLEKAIPAAAASRHAHREGAVQAAVSAFSDSTRVMLDREVIPHFLDTPTKKSVLEPLSKELVAALNRAQPVKSKVPDSFGAECDLLGVDKHGRLLAVEVKPSASSLVYTPAQATMYARVLQMWVDQDSCRDHGWPAVIPGMLQQRQQLGLVPQRFAVELPDRPQVIPVITFQRGASPALVEGLWKVQQALLDAGVGDPALEVYQVSLSGRLDRLEPPRW